MPDHPDLGFLLGPIGPTARRPTPAWVLRRPAEADVPVIDARLRDWLEPGQARFLGRIWFRDFAGTSWLAEADEPARPIGIALGFRSQDRPAEAVLRLVAVDLGLRRRGIGRALVERFADDLRAAGATLASTTCRPDDRAALAFLQALGFVIDEGPGTRRIYGVPTHEGWDGAGEDRVLLQRSLA